MQVAVHRHGCCVLQRCLDAAGPDLRIKLVDEVGAVHRFVCVFCFCFYYVCLFCRLLYARRVLLLAHEAARGRCVLWWLSFGPPGVLNVERRVRYSCLSAHERIEVDNTPQ